MDISEAHHNDHRRRSRRDFHNFNMLYRDNELYDVVAFTAAQMPDIAGRKYPASLAGSSILTAFIMEEKDLERLVREHNVDEVVFSYQRCELHTVMSIGSRAMAAGAGFKMLSPEQTMVKARSR